MSYWTKVILVPLAFTLLADRITKNWFLTFSEQYPEPNSFLNFYLYKNTGFMLGTLSDLPQNLIIVGMSAAAAGLIISYFLLVSLFPIRSAAFHAGLSFLFAGALGNILDRIYYGYVIDGLQITSRLFSTGVFNFADALQWVGVILIFWVLIFRGPTLWPEIENRSGWINPKFQWRLSLKFLFSGLAITAIAGIYSFTFFRWTVTGAEPSPQKLYVVSFLSIGVACSLALFYFGKVLSARIAGPIFAFERFLDNLTLGQNSNFKLRTQDEAFNFQNLTSKFQQLFNEKLGIDKQPLPKGYLAPGFHAITHNKKSISLENYRGKKVWLCLLRYATCPVCSYFLQELTQWVAKHNPKNLQIIVIFDSPAESFLQDGSKSSKKLLASLTFPVLFDPEKTIYRHYRARNDIWAVLKPTVAWTSLKAVSLGFLQTRINGDIDQVPAHILIDEAGKVFLSHHGDTIDSHIPWATVEKFIE